MVHGCRPAQVSLVAEGEENVPGVRSHDHTMVICMDVNGPSAVDVRGLLRGQIGEQVEARDLQLAGLSRGGAPQCYLLKIEPQHRR